MGEYTKPDDLQLGGASYLQGIVEVYTCLVGSTGTPYNLIVIISHCSKSSPVDNSVWLVVIRIQSHHH